MLRLRTIAEVRSIVEGWKHEGLMIGLVPTMGALHEGHLALVDRSRALSDRTIVSIFVNPTQFGPGEDFSRYPRQEDRDFALLEARGCDAVFSPGVEEMYPDAAGGAADIATTVTVDGLSDRLCGVHRPGHFSGVATVVLKLLLIVSPHVAVFGEKDYQQLQVIRRMVRDLNVPVVIEGVATVREPDGLAMSSRNAYLAPDLRSKAPLLYATLSSTAAAIRNGADPAGAVEKAATRLLEGGFRSVDYVTLVDGQSLETLQTFYEPARLLAAARLGTTRLIDSVPV
ncbi:MAG: pantoate--beta-alanine ligase [Vicinamibacterales bacterium]